jgi:hypothetical protein
MVSIVNPMMVVFDGKLFAHGAIREELVRNLNEHTFFVADDIQYVFKPHNEGRCAAGAAAYAIKKFFFKTK